MLSGQPSPQRVCGSMVGGPSAVPNSSLGGPRRPRMIPQRLVALCAATALLLSPGSVWADGQVAQDSRPSLAQALRLFGEWLDAKLAYDRIPGASVALVVDQELAWSKGFGFSDLARRAPTTPDTIYGICSISKLFTAIAVMQLRDAGKLHLDAPVRQYLPYFSLRPTTARDPEPTIRDLLTHSSGVPRESVHSYWDEPNFTFPSKEEVIAGLEHQRMLYPPERYYQYSNLGLTLAGLIVERVSGMPYEQYVRESILEPLRLPSTTTRLPENERGKALATGYGRLTRDGTREIMPFYRAGGITPAAGFASTARDLAAFAVWQFRLLDTDGNDVLKASTLREMQRVQWLDPDWEAARGLGFGIYRDGNVSLVGHYGSCPGYRTALRLDPKRKVASVVMVNAMNVNAERIAELLLEVVRVALVDRDRSVPQVNPADVGIERFTGLFRSAWGEMAVVPWQDGLAVLDLPSPGPLVDLVRLRHTEGNAFRRIRDDGDDLGEEVIFEAGPDGHASRLLWHQTHWERFR